MATRHSARLRAALCAAVVLCAHAVCAAAEVKPLRILAGYRDLQDIYLDLMERCPYYYQAFYGVLETRQLRDCSGIVVAAVGGTDAKATEEVRAFLDDGGSLALVGDAAAPFLKTLSDVFGPKAQLRAWGQDGLDPQMDHPLLAGTDAALWPKVKIAKGLAGVEGGESVLGETIPGGGQVCAIWAKQVGKGRLVFIADDLFPPYPAQGPKPAAFAGFQRNLLGFLNAPRMEQAVEEKSPVAWYREPSFDPFEGARSFYPLAPAKGERLESLALSAGRGEHERALFYVTFPSLPDAVKVVVTPLQGQAGAVPADRVRVGIQDRLNAQFRGPLVFVRWLDKDEAMSATSPVLTCWIDLDAGDAAPGAYTGALRLSASPHSLELPLKLTVLAARVPRQRPFHFEVEYYNVVTEKPRVEYMRHWRDYGVDTVIGGMIHHHGMDPPVRATGQKLTEFAKASEKPLRDGLPRLDFSVYDPFFQEALRHDLTLFRTYEWFLGAQNFLAWAKALYRDDKLTAHSPETAQTAAAVLRDLRLYLYEKGYRDVYSKTGDEWGPDELDAYLRTATPVNAAGWGNVANPGLEVLTVRDARRKLWPTVAVWWMEGEPTLWHRLRAAEPQMGGPAEVERGYWMVLTSSFWWNQNYLTGLRMGWAGARHDYQGLHYHGFSRWSEPARGAYLLTEGNRDLVCPSVGYLMLAEGIEEAQYPVMLKDMIAALERLGKGQVAAELKAELGRIVDESPAAMLPVVKDTIARPGITRQDFVKAKLAVCGLIEKARPHLRQVQPSLAWGRFALVDKARAASVVYDAKSADAAKALQAAVKARSGASMGLLSVADLAGQETAKLRSGVVLADLSDDDLCRRVSAMLNGVVNARYPASGGYAIVEDAGGRLWIAARGPEALRLGAENLVRAARLQPVWWEASSD